MDVQRNVNESPRKEVEVVWACDVKRGSLCGKEGGGNERRRDEGIREDEGEG